MLFTNEENGLAGGRAYLDRYRSELANHVLMLESDSGVFRPTGFGFTGSADRARDDRSRSRACSAAFRSIRSARQAAAPTSDRASRPGKLPAMSLEVEGNYFLIHHTAADTVDKIDPVGHGQGVRGDRRHGLRRR